MRHVPTISHPTDRPNFTVVGVGSLSLAFSYETVIGFSSPNTGWRWVVSENQWSNTTGRHLNWLDGGKGERLPREEFEEKLMAEVEATEA